MIALTTHDESIRETVRGELRLMIAGDSPEARTSERRLLESNSAMQLAGESPLGAEAVAVAREMKPQVIAVSLEEPLARGLRTIEALTAALPNTPVVAISNLSDRDNLRRAMMAGARDYLIRPFGESEFAKTMLAAYDAERKRRSAGEAAEHGNAEVITIFGAKGGIGRTMLACNLAVALALHCRQRTVLVDLDLQFGDVGLLLNIPPQRTIADLLSSGEKLDADLLGGYLSRHDTGLMVLPAPTRPEDGEKVQAADVRRILQLLARGYDYVIVDTPRALNDNVIAALDLSTQVHCVASDQLACLKSTRLCLDMMSEWQYGEDKVKLVVNQAHHGAGLPAEEARKAVDYPILWKVPYDGELVASNQWGKPFVQAHPKAAISRNITGLAEALSGIGQPARRGFISRLRGR
jgi:pilus assembly protein CpaE